jgi:hypothetical protein
MPHEAVGICPKRLPTGGIGGTTWKSTSKQNSLGASLPLPVAVMRTVYGPCKAVENGNHLRW